MFPSNRDIFCFLSDGSILSPGDQVLALYSCWERWVMTNICLLEVLGEMLLSCLSKQVVNKNAEPHLLPLIIILVNFSFGFVFFFNFIFGCVGSLLLCVGFLQLQRAEATLCCSVQASHCGGFSCCGAQVLVVRASVVVARGFQSAGLVVVAHGPSCSTACGIFLDQGSNPCALHWQVDS